MVPLVDLPRTEQTRRVFVSGSLDTDTVVRVAAELMELDGRSADDVELVINSDGGPLADVLGLVDVIGSMRAKVDTVCMGRATGTAAVLVTCGTGRRRAGPHATISLRHRVPEQLEGSSAALRAQLDDLDHLRRQVIAAVARATGRPNDEIEHDLDAGPLLDRDQATAAGMLDP
jgi:ATP-dependent Clp protease protease subunit